VIDKPNYNSKRYQILKINPFPSLKEWMRSDPPRRRESREEIVPNLMGLNLNTKNLTPDHHNHEGVEQITFGKLRRLDI